MKIHLYAYPKFAYVSIQTYPIVVEHRVHEYLVVLVLLGLVGRRPPSRVASGLAATAVPLGWAAHTRVELMDQRLFFRLSLQQPIKFALSPAHLFLLIRFISPAGTLAAATAEGALRAKRSDVRLAGGALSASGSA